MSDKREVHLAWAPPKGRWTRWVKPVLFSNLERNHLEWDEEDAPVLPAADAQLEQRILAPLAESTAPYRSPAKNGTALVIDLPGAEGTYLGISLAHQGFRPIPLYNAIPMASGLVDHELIMRALVAGHGEVARVNASAPPAFLLDALRLVGSRAPSPGLYDNRSVCRSSDFPSGALLLGAGISRVIVVATSIQADLGEVLLEWQREGIALWHLPSVGDAAPFVQRGPGFLRRFVTAVFGDSRLPRARPDGMFGELILPPSAG